MNTIKVFENKEFGNIRTIEINNAPYFFGKDVADILGYERPAKAILDHVDEDDKDEVPIQDSIGRMQNTPVINESGLYSLILSSKLPTSKKFKNWVTSEVLPSIRKHGGYLSPEKIEEVLLNPDTIIRLATDLKAERQERQHLQAQVEKKNQLIGELKPKADYTDWILQNPGLVTITQIAKDYGMSGKKLNAILSDAGIQYKQSGQWLLYRKYHGMGYTHSETIAITLGDGRETVKMNTKWTQKGRLFIYELLKKQHIFPIVEQKKTA